MERSDEDVLAGILRIPVGGDVKLVPTLSIAATREWSAHLTDTVSDFVAPDSDEDWTATTVAGYAGLSMDTILDMVVSYDRQAKLGGREWLLEHADPAQLYAAAIAMAEVAFPFAKNVPLLLGALVASRSLRQPSTNGLSPIGDSTPEPSKHNSTRAS